MVGINEILIFLVGGIIGFVICRFTLGTKQKDLESTKADLEQYKAQVTNHFNDSAKLMGEVASSYQALYKHMAGQSQTLLSDSDTETQPFPQLEVSSEETQTVEEEATQEIPETAQDDVSEETSETALKNDAEETSEETAKKQTTQEKDAKAETDKESTPQESSEETKEAQPKK